MRPLFRPVWLSRRFLPTASQYMVPHRMKSTSAKKPAPAKFSEHLIAPGSAHHNSLSSFLEYAKRAQLAPRSTVYVGTHYEYTAALALMRLGFSLLRVGGKQDAGIDLIGHWLLEPFHEPMPVIVQCKAWKSSVDPSHIRELEGSFQAIPSAWKNRKVLGLLVTTAKATKGILETVGQSRWPMGFIFMSKEGTILQFVWNHAATERGLEGVGVTVRHTPRSPITMPEAETNGGQSKKSKGRKLEGESQDTGTDKDIQLTWMGSPIFPERQSLDPSTIKIGREIDMGEEAEIEGDGPSQSAAYTEQDQSNGLPRKKTVSRKRGRPKGSKNKAKMLLDGG